MQVSPDNTVRITETSPIGRIPVSPEHAAGLSNGDFLVATVEQVQGDTLLLRLDGGVFLNAALQGNMQLIQGDVIEAAVSKDGGTCLLYIVNVLHTGSQAAKDTAVSVSPQTLSAMLSVIKRNPGLDADIALYLAQNNIPDTAENIAALSQMSRGTGIGALLGQVLALMAGSAETAQADGAVSPAVAGDTALPQGETIPAGQQAAPESGQSQPGPTIQGQAAVSGQTQPAAQGQGTAPQTGTQAAGPNPQAAATETNPAAPNISHTDPGQGAPVQPQAAGAEPQAVRPGAIPAPRTGEPGVSQSAERSAAPEAQTANTIDTVQPQPATRQGIAGTAQPQTAPSQNAAGTVQPQAPSQGPPPNTDLVPGAADGNAPYDARNIAAQPASQAPQSGRTVGVSPEPVPQEASGGQTVRTDTDAPHGPEEQIGKLIKGLFLQQEEHTGKEVKRTADDMSRGLKTLKSELIQTDIKYRELCLKSVDQALRQIEMADRAAHFEHMQIPFAVKEGEHRTAELYVFRRKNGRKSAGEAGRSILLALDTDHMGRVETLIREESGSIALEFRLQKTDVSETFKKHSAPLKAAVEAAGYKLSGMRFTGLEKRTTVLNAGEMVPLDAGSAPHGIDVQI